MRQEDATPLFLTMERLPQDVAAGVARDVTLINLRDRVRRREMANATWWKGPELLTTSENSQGALLTAEYTGNYD